MVFYSLSLAILYDTLQEDKIWRSVFSSVIDGRMGGYIVGVNGWRLEGIHFLHHCITLHCIARSIFANAVVRDT
jgi:hypothetical protein